MTYNNKYSIKEQRLLQLKNKKIHFIRSTLNTTNISLIDRIVQNSNNGDGDIYNEDADGKDIDDGDIDDDGSDDEKFGDGGGTNDVGDDCDDDRHDDNDDEGDDDEN